MVRARCCGHSRRLNRASTGSDEEGEGGEIEGEESEVLRPLKTLE